jgi:transposase
VTKSDQKPAKSSKNNIEANDEKCHLMRQLMLAEGEHAQEISELVDALRKIGYFESFQTKEKHTLSSDNYQETRSRKIKHRRKAAYRRIKKYYKSTRQYKKERLRRKLCWLLTGKYREAEIAEMLGISVRTVIRDLNRIRPYYFRLSRAYFRELEQERIKEFNAKLEGKALLQRLKILSEAIVEQRRRWKIRQYRRHYQIIMLDMTQADKYGIPKLTFIPKGGQTLAYPYKVRVHFKGAYEGSV